MKWINYKFVFCLTLISFFSLKADEQSTIYQKILNQNIQAYEYDEKECISDRYRDFLTWTLENQENLIDFRKRRVGFLLFDRYIARNCILESQVLNDPIVWKDLNLFCGQKDLKVYLADKIDRTNTMIGKAMLYGMLAQPISDINVLQNRQKMIRQLLENKELCQELQQAITKHKNSENLFLSYWSQDPFKQIAGRRFFSYGSKKINDAFNRNVTLLNVRNTLDHIMRVTYAASLVVAVPLLPVCAIAQMSDYQLPETFKDAGAGFRGSALPFLALIPASFKNKGMLAFCSLVAGVVCLLNCKECYEWMTDNFLLDTYVQAKIMYVARIVESMQEIKTVIQKNPELAQCLEHSKNLDQFFDDKVKNNPDLNQLMQLLSSEMFNKKPSLFANKGKIFLAYKLFTENKIHFEDSLVAFGEIDAYVSLAKLYREFEKKDKQYCFVQFKDADTPSISAKEFWNPFIDPRKVVSNTLEMGGINRRNVILTGPNAGGKSTLLKSLAISIIMAQSFGIAPAQEIEITPFTKMITYLNITDDIGAGNSLFKAQVLRAQYLIDAVSNLKENEFSFTIVDEMFNGTSPKEAQACAFSVAKSLGHLPTNLGIVATHFDLLTKLEEQTLDYTNYHVSVERLRSGGISYPFKLHKGISDQHVALDILRAEGFSGSIVGQAQEILEN